MQVRKYLKIQIILSAVLLQGSFLYSKAQGSDSSEKVVPSDKLNTSRLLSFHHNLNAEYTYADFKKAVYYARSGIALAEKKNNPEQKGTFYTDLGIAHYMFNNTDSALSCLNLAFEYAVAAKNEKLKTYINVILGNLYHQKGLYTEAMQYYMLALNGYEKEKEKEQLCILYSNIATLYQNLQNFNHALNFYYKADFIARELGDHYHQGHIWIAISTIYIEKENYAIALFYAERALEIIQLLHDPDNEVNALLTIGQCYYKGFQFYERAENYAKKSLQLSEENGLFSKKAASLLLLSDIAFSLNLYRKSEDYAFQALETDSSNTNLNRELLYNIAIANIKMGNNNKAAEYFNNYADLIQTHTNKKNQNSFSDLLVKYETEKKETGIVSLEKEKNFSNLIATTGGMLLLVLSGVMLLRYKVIQKRKQLIEQKALQEIQEQKMIATQAILEGETSGQDRLAKTLHDSLSGKLSIVKTNLQQLKENKLFTTEIEDEFDKLTGIIDNSIKELNRTAVYIMPESLTNYGLKTSLTDFCKTIPNVQFLFLGKDRRLNSMLELMIYRTVYELVTDALQHEKTMLVCIQLIFENDRGFLTIQEDNKELNSEFLENKVITSIRNRIKNFNGFVNLFYSEKMGLEVDIEFKI